MPLSVENRVEITARQRAPTLTAGASGGARGEVEVWSPCRRLLWLALAGELVAVNGGPLAVLSIVALTAKGMDFSTFVYLALIWLWVGIVMSRWGRPGPCYFTTDNDGIAMATSKGSRALRWSEIRSARLTTGTPSFEPGIVLQAPDCIEINLAGFPRRSRRRLQEIIVNRAHLTPTPGSKGMRFHRSAPRTQG